MNEDFPRDLSILDDTEQIQQALDGDEAIWNRLLEAVRQDITRYWSHKGVPPAIKYLVDENDIASVTCFRLDQRFRVREKKLLERPKSFRAYCREISTNHVRDEIDRLKAKKRPDSGNRVEALSSSSDFLNSIADPGRTPGTIALKNDEKEQLQSQLHLLDPRDQTILKLRYIDGLAWNAVAERVNLSESHVQARFRQARQRLRTKLKATGGFSSFFNSANNDS